MTVMSSGAVTDAIVSSGVVAILRAPSADAFAAVGEVLVEAGITAIEVTLTSRGALDAIAGLRRQLPERVVIGAGTVLGVEDAKASMAAGAQFLISPVYVPELDGLDVPVYPGAYTPSEIFAASRGGAPLVKLFPAGAVGPRYLKDVHGPFPGIRIMPTGGVEIDDIAAWIGAGAAAVGLGGPLLGDAATGGSLAELAVRARRAAHAVEVARS
jgi:2-dehydro-3-deoxyphosphogluconate aldolase/(4S)-4-hydroxy-2-oxoglutarate aldolase